MGRAERRRGAKAAAKPPVSYAMTLGQVQQVKDEATTEATNTAMLLMLSLPILVIEEHFGELMRLNVDGKTRSQRFTDLVLQYYRDFEDGKATLDYYRDILWDKAGIKLVMK